VKVTKYNFYIEWQRGCLNDFLWTKIGLTTAFNNNTLTYYEQSRLVKHVSPLVLSAFALFCLLQLPAVQLSNWYKIFIITPNSPIQFRVRPQAIRRILLLSTFISSASPLWLFLAIFLSRYPDILKIWTPWLLLLQLLYRGKARCTSWKGNREEGSGDNRSHHTEHFSVLLCDETIPSRRTSPFPLYGPNIFHEKRTNTTQRGESSTRAIHLSISTGSPWVAANSRWEG